MSKQPTIEAWPIEKVVPYPKNAKKHTDQDIDKLAKSINEFGWTAPIVVDKDGVIIAGHGRRLAAIKLGLKKVPVLVRSDLTPDQIKALRLADNKVAALGYDEEILKLEMRDLHVAGFDLKLAGFEDKEIGLLIEDPGEMDLGAFSDDIESDVASQKEDSEAKVAETDAREVPIAKALGFKSVPGAHERTIQQFMAQIESESGLKGADALIDFIEKAA
jgi:ParB-like chromosome segregation protein Spo0J